MSQKKKVILGLLAFMLFIAVAVFLYNKEAKKITPKQETPSSENTVEKAPDFVMQDSQGNKLPLSEKFGKPIVMNFWASWCPPCQSEMPLFQKMYDEIGSDVTFLMVNMVDGKRETVDTGAQYISEQGYTFPVYFDIHQEVSLAYNLRAFPTTLFLDREGRLITGHTGAIDENTLRKSIQMIQK
ncbi:MAG: TlpA disulfide reductase family protein [Lachnospiraceae bacterium]